MGYHPATLEVYAVREALALAEDLGVQRLHVASDCLTVINDIHQRTGGQHGAVIREIISHSRSFISCTFGHEHRCFNAEAHNLAKHSCNLEVGRHLWLGIPHDQNLVPMNISEF